MSRNTHHRTHDHHGTQLDTTVVLDGAVGGTADGATVHQALVDLEAIAAAGLTNPMTTAEDLIKGGTGGTPTRFAKGANGTILKVIGSALTWAVENGLINPMTTAGDLIRGGASGTPTRIPIGTEGQILVVNGSTIPAWADPPPVGFVNPMTTLGDMIRQSTGGAAVRLPIGSAGQVLAVSGGLPAWVTIPAALQVIEADGSPAVSSVVQIVVDSGSLTDLGGGTAQIDTSVTGSAGTSEAVFGDPTGAVGDGDCTVNSGAFSQGPITNNALTRDAYFHNLTINSTRVLDLAGFRLFVSGTLTNNGTIRNNGANGGNGGNGTVSAGGGAGTAGGAGAVGSIGIGGNNGRNGGAGGALNAAGGNGLAAVAGTIDSSKTSPAGGAGGKGDNNLRNGGTAGASAAWTAAANQKPFVYPFCITWRDEDGTGFTAASVGGQSGSGGGGGGSAAGGGGGGGASGSVGGICIIAAKTLSGSGVFEAKGGTGGNGGNGFGNGGAGGGGGGGNGGFITLLYGSDSGWSGSLDVSGGSGGSAGTLAGTGAAGTGGGTGATGTALYLRMT